MLPSWMGHFTTASLVLWGFTIAGLYVRFIFNFINDQILPEESRFVQDGWASLGLFVPIGIAVYVITLPPKFSGDVVKVITNVNLATTWVVIVTAMVKGVYMVFDTPEEKRPPEFEQWRPQGFLQVTVLLAGAMFQCSAVPRLQYEIIPELRERAAVMIPLLLAVVQGGLFLIIGLIGYWALGPCVNDDGDVFKSYYDVRPDWMVTVLQGGIAILMFLSLPLLGVPPKSELWAVTQLGKADEDKVAFEDSPLASQLGVNLVMVLFATFITPLLGSQQLTAAVTVLAGTAGNWLNLFLPSFVNLYANVFPSRAEGKPFAFDLSKSAWILFVALLCAGSSVFEIVGLFTSSEEGLLISDLSETVNETLGFCAELR